MRRRGFEYDPRTSVWEEIDNAKGTFQLWGNDTPVPPDRTITDLTGPWRSVFWQENLRSVRKTYDDINLTGDAVAGTFATEKSAEDGEVDGESPLRISAYLSSDGYFSGHWWDVRDGLYGTFQLKVAPGGERMSGRWLGFDSDTEVRVGTWRFSRRSDGDGEGRAVADPNRRGP